MHHLAKHLRTMIPESILNPRSGTQSSLACYCCCLAGEGGQASQRSSPDHKPTLHPPPHASGDCPAVSGYTMFPGADHPEDDIVQVPAGSSPDTMAAACDALPGCLSFNWAPDGHLGWLKAATTPTLPNVGSSTCYYVRSGTYPGMTDGCVV